MTDPHWNPLDLTNSINLNLFRTVINNSYPLVDITNLIKPNFICFLRRGAGGTILLQVRGDRTFNIAANDIFTIGDLLRIALIFRTTITESQESENQENRPI